MLGNNLKVACASRNMMFKELAEKIGVTAPQLSLWAKGANAPSVKYALAIAEVLDYKVEDLFYIKK